MTEQATTLVISVVSFLGALVLWAIIWAVATPFRFLKAERAIGRWTGTRFLYNEPLLLGTVEWSAANNNDAFAMGVPNVPPGALIDYKIEVDGPVDRINCLVVGAYYFYPPDELMKTARWDIRGRVVLRKDGKLGLVCHSRPNTLPAIIRVFSLAWEIAPEILLDYTDLNTGSRFTLGPPDEKKPVV